MTASEALDERLIDVVAASEEELLAELDGFEVQGPKAQTLETAGLVIDERDMPLQYELLQLLVNPTVAYLLVAGRAWSGSRSRSSAPASSSPGRWAWSRSCSAPTEPRSCR